MGDAAVDGSFVVALARTASSARRARGSAVAPRGEHPV